MASTGLSQQIAAQLSSLLVTNYNQIETNVIWDALSRLTIRGGYRYVWGDANQTILPPAGLASADYGKLRRNIVLGGFTFRPIRKLAITGDAEGASASREYFRTSLHDYQKARAQVRYQIMPSLSFSGNFTLLSNQNPVPGIRYDYQAHQESLSFLWSPAAGKNFDVQGSYSRSNLRSDLAVLSPQDLLPQQSSYRGQGTYRHRAHQRKPAPHRRPGAKNYGWRSVLHFLRQPAYNLLSARYEVVAPLKPAAELVCGVALLRIRGSVLLYEGFRTHTVTAGLRIAR